MAGLVKCRAWESPHKTEEPWAGLQLTPAPAACLPDLSFSFILKLYIFNGFILPEFIISPSHYLPPSPSLDNTKTSPLDPYRQETEVPEKLNNWAKVLQLISGGSRQWGAWMAIITFLFLHLALPCPLKLQPGWSSNHDWKLKGWQILELGGTLKVTKPYFFFLKVGKLRLIVTQDHESKSSFHCTRAAPSPTCASWTWVQILF